MIEKRGILRQRTSLNGEVLVGLGEITLRCVVSDVSPNGAKLTLSSEQPYVLPPSFHLSGWSISTLMRKLG